MAARRKVSEESGADPKQPPTRDMFHDSAFEVLQPANGHRAGMDALLIAAALAEDAEGIVADLGAGAGTAGLAALNLNRELDLLAVEKNSEMIGFLEKTANLKHNLRFSSRMKILEADVSLSGLERERAGLLVDSVDHVIMNPPYNFSDRRPPKDELKAEAYMMGAGGLDAWFRTAAAIVKPGGTLCMIYRTENLGEILACTQSRFGGIEILPIHSRANEAAKRLLVRGKRGSRAPFSLAPGFIVHETDGSFTPKAKAIFDGKARLEFATA